MVLLLDIKTSLMKETEMYYLEVPNVKHLPFVITRSLAARYRQTPEF